MNWRSEDNNAQSRWASLAFLNIKIRRKCHTAASLANFWENNLLSRVCGFGRVWYILVAVMLTGWIVIHEKAHGGFGKRVRQT